MTKRDAWSNNTANLWISKGVKQLGYAEKNN